MPRIPTVNVAQTEDMEQLLLRPLFGRRKKLGFVILQQLKELSMWRHSKHSAPLAAAISGSKGSSGLGLLSFSCKQG